MSKEKIIEESKTIIEERIYWTDYSKYTKVHYFSSWKEFVDTRIALAKEFPDFVFSSGIWFGLPWRNDGYCSFHILDKNYEYLRPSFF